MAIRILGINGSLRAGSPSDRALAFTFGLLEARGAQCHSFEIGSLPFMDMRPDAEYPAAVSVWRAACEAADALVVAVPNFHGGAPGGLINAIDFLDRDQLAGKPFAVIGVAVGDASPGVTDVTRFLRHIGGSACVMDVVISRCRQHWGEGAEPENKGVALAIDQVTEDLMAACEQRASSGVTSP